MNKNLLLLSAILFYSLTFAQAPQGFNLAVGINNSSLNSDLIKTNAATGLVAGLGFNWGYHETHNYEVNLVYSEAAQEFPYIHEYNVGESGVQKYKYASLDLLLHFNYYFIKPDEDKLYLGAQGGGFVSLNTNGWSPKKDVDDTSRIVPIADSQRPGFNTSNLTLVSKINLGPSVGIVAGYNNFRLSLKYNLGTTNIFKDVQTNEVDESNRYLGPSLNGKLSSMTVTLYYNITN